MERATNAVRATEILRQEHRTIEMVLTAVESLVAGHRRTAAGTWSRVVDFLASFADRCHHLKEEDLLFPALVEKGMPADQGPLHCLRADHVQARAHIQAMRDGLAAWDADPDSARQRICDSARRYAELLRFHIAKEDQVLFSLADDLLGEADQVALAERFQESERLAMGEAPHRRYQIMARSLCEEAGVDDRATAASTPSAAAEEAARLSAVRSRQ
jgi:hemerythrin-like domain-containing protein